ncbi:MAG: hypothetical protein WCX71_05580 [Candidatus Buchananbacteria bacterium]
MPPVEKSAFAPKSAKPMNIWLIVSIILAVALIGVIGYSLSTKLAKGDKGMKIVKSDEAANTLIGFVNEVYGDRVGTVALKGVTEKNGLYEVTFSMTSNGTPTDQIVFVTKDAKIFIPQVIDMAQMQEQYKAYLQQQQAAGTQNTNTDAAANTAEQPAQPTTAAAQ